MEVSSLVSGEGNRLHLLVLRIRIMNIDCQSSYKSETAHEGDQYFFYNVPVCVDTDVRCM